MKPIATHESPWPVLWSQWFRHCWVLAEWNFTWHTKWVSKFQPLLTCGNWDSHFEELVNQHNNVWLILEHWWCRGFAFAFCLFPEITGTVSIMFISTPGRLPIAPFLSEPTPPSKWWLCMGSFHYHCWRLLVQVLEKCQASCIGLPPSERNEVLQSPSWCESYFFLSSSGMVILVGIISVYCVFKFWGMLMDRT